MRVAEVAPAVGQMRRQPQRGLIICGGGFEIAPNHAGIAEFCMQLRDGFDRDVSMREILDHGETALIRRDRVIDLAGGVIFQPNAQLSCDERPGNIYIVRET
jgi:hypothetical protein